VLDKIYILNRIKAKEVKKVIAVLMVLSLVSVAGSAYP
jgi:hypothetical protein